MKKSKHDKLVKDYDKSKRKTFRTVRQLKC